MRLKKFGTLLMAGAMLVGTIGGMSPTQARAAEANTYTMTVPADMVIESAGWNTLGNIQVTGTVDTGKKVTVTAETRNSFALKSEAGGSVSYTMKTASNDTESKTSFEFDAASIIAESASQTIGVYVEDFSGKAAGTYTDTITFTGTMSDAGSTGGTPQASDVFNEGAQVEVRFSDLQHNRYGVCFVYDNETYTCNKVTINDADETGGYAQYCTANRNEQSFDFALGNTNITVDTANNTYQILYVGSVTSDISLDGFLINGTDIANQLTQVMD